MLGASKLVLKRAVVGAVAVVVFQQPGASRLLLPQCPGRLLPSLQLRRGLVRVEVLSHGSAAPPTHTN